MGFLTDTETETIRDSFIRSRGNRPRTLAEVNKVLEWAEDAKFRQLTLGNVLDGIVSIDVDENDEVVFSLTANGEVEAEDLLRDNGIET